MKKLFLTIGIAAISGMAFSQNAIDALTMSQTNPVLGTARYSGMAGAFNALGGNPSAIKDNPAALGVYRSSDLTFSPSMYINNDGDLKGALDNFAFVINLPSKKQKHGYITSSIGFNYNRLINFSRYTRNRGERVDFSLSDEFAKDGPGSLYYDKGVELGIINDNEGKSCFGGDEVIRKNTMMEKGHVGQWDIAYGLNISNLAYLGASLSFTTLEYKQTTMFEETTLPDEAFDRWYSDQVYYADGHGFNFRLGAIVRPIDEFRFGVSFETPTYYKITDYSDMQIDDDMGDPLKIDDSELRYSMRTPLKFKTGVGIVIGKNAMIGVDYQYENFKKLRLKYDDIYLDNETDVAETQMNAVHTLKLGGEVQVVDGFFLRAGLAYASAPMNDYDRDVAENTVNYRMISIPRESIFVTGGAGYKGEHFYCDLAYAFQNKKEILYNYLPIWTTDEPTKHDLKTRNIIATFGWRF